ncbi:potassium channel, putative [Plasmodium malariae]|uniref:Potassium channel, putative n=1 Tax=Plasmodium malariae TaxID=5858 RepID=A0A1C3L183_PLAMA|nr:potassium channel, putative [Plasmodium malariae]
MKRGLLSIYDIFFLVKNISKYFLIFLNGLYIMKLLYNSNNSVNFISGVICIIIGLTLKIILLAIYCIFFMDIYIFKECKRKNFLTLFNLNKINRNLNATMVESDDFEYKKLIKEFFFQNAYYALKKKHKTLELYMLKIYNSIFNYYLCNIRDILYAVIWYISLYYWRRDKYDIIWSFDKIPEYIYEILIILLSSSYIDLIMIILSYNKSKFYVMKSKLLIDLFFSAPSIFFFSNYIFVIDNKIDVYFVMGFLRNIKIFLNVSYTRVEQNSLLTHTEIKIIRIVLGVLLLCNAFASTIYTIQAIHPYNLKHGNFSYFLNSYLDYFYFSIISISTVGYGDIFPINKLSKVVCIFFIFWTFVWVPIQFNDLIISIFSKKNTYGKISMSRKKFILLIGDVEPHQLNIFLYESVAYGNKLKIHILTTYPISFYNEQIKIASHFCISLYIKNFDFNEKQITNLLYSVNAQNAYYLFLFSDKFNSGRYNIDTKTFTRLLILKNFLHGKKNAVIELRNKCVSNIVQSIGSENFIIVNLKQSLIAKNIKHPGFITLILNLFTAYDYDENSYNFDNIHSFTSIKYVREFNRGSRAKIFSFFVHENMVGLKFDKLFHKLYDSLGIILIGIETDTMNNTYKHRNKNIYFFKDKIANIIKKNQKKKKKKFKFIQLHLLNKYVNALNCIQHARNINRYNSSKKENGYDTGKLYKQRCIEKETNLLKIRDKDEYANTWKQYESNNDVWDRGTYETIHSQNCQHTGKIQRNNILMRKKNKLTKEEHSANICINISNNVVDNKMKRKHSIDSEKYLKDLKNLDYNRVQTKTNICRYDNNINKSNKKVECYLNLLGKNYAMKENDKCIVIANSKKVIKYLSKAKSLFWLFEIKSKKEDKISYDLKSVIKTEQTFSKDLPTNLKKNTRTVSSMKSKSLITKNENVTAINYHDLFNTYRISRIFTRKSYYFEKGFKKIISEEVENRHDSLNLKEHMNAKCNTYNYNTYKCNDNNTLNCYNNAVSSCFNYSYSRSCSKGNTNGYVNMEKQLYIKDDSINYMERRKKCPSFLKYNIIDNKPLNTYYSELLQKCDNNFYYKKKLKKKIFLNNYFMLNDPYNFRNREEILKKKKMNVKNFNSSLKKSAVACSYVEAREKYFVKNNKRILLIINYSSHIIQVIKRINKKYKFNIIILTHEIPSINICDLYEYHTVFIKCKSLDDYNLLNAGLVQADYILILPTEVSNIDEINETDMNNIILTRKIKHLLKKRKKTYYINNIITELINHSNVIFLEENKMIKLREKKFSYSDFFPYVNSSLFYSSNIICETMLYNFMTHHKSFTKFSVCNNTLKYLIKHISIIRLSNIIKYFDFSFKKVKTFRDIFYFLSQKNIITIALYRKGDKHIPFYIYTKPNEKCVLRFDDIIYIL